MDTDTNDEPDAADASADKPAPQPRKRRMARERKGTREPTPKPATSAEQSNAGTKERGRSKIAAVIALLEREQGATLAEMVEATGWLPTRRGPRSPVSRRRATLSPRTSGTT